MNGQRLWVFLLLVMGLVACKAVDDTFSEGHASATRSATAATDPPPMKVNWQEPSSCRFLLTSFCGLLGPPLHTGERARSSTQWEI